jgi:transmembrane sensor
MLRREAAGWLARLQSGRDPDIGRKFQRWRDADPRHGEAFDRVFRTYEEAGLLRLSPNIRSDQPESDIRKPRWKPVPALAAAAAIIVLVPTGIAFFRSGGLPLVGTDSVMLMTSVGEIKQVDLPDGSKVTLDTATKVEVEIGPARRSARLRYGRARFQVVRAGVPFTVEAKSLTVTADAGVIDVERGARQDRVEVLAGAAEARGPGQDDAPPVTLAAGEGVAVNSGGMEQKRIAAPAADWTRGMLQFDGTPLGEAVALANRYSKRHILLIGDLDALRVTGAFRAGDTAGLATALAEAFGLSLENRADGSLALSRKGASRAP